MDAQEAWNLFYDECMQRLHDIYPMRTITMTSADLPFYTLSLRLLLWRKNRLMHVVRLDEASACARRVSIAIERETKSHLRDVNPRNGLGDLWRRVGEVTKC